MADSKISALTDGSPIAAGDLLPIDRGGNNFKVKAVGADGWIDDTAEIWTYASGSGGGVATFTVPGDLRARYTVGTRIKLTQTTVKYFVISADPTYDGTNTTVTITGGSDYTLANAAIGQNFHSYQSNPQGYPGSFTYTTNATGFSAKTSDTAKFTLSGRICVLVTSIVGTSNSASFLADLPIAPATTEGGVCLGTNNGASTFLRYIMTGGSTSAALTFGATAASAGGFATSGTKAANGGVMTYTV